LLRCLAFQSCIQNRRACAHKVEGAAEKWGGTVKFFLTLYKNLCSLTFILVPVPLALLCFLLSICSFICCQFSKCIWSVVSCNIMSARPLSLGQLHHIACGRHFTARVRCYNLHWVRLIPGCSRPRNAVALPEFPGLKNTSTNRFISPHLLILS